jgi:hypothetical protein
VNGETFLATYAQTLAEVSERPRAGDLTALMRQIEEVADMLLHSSVERERAAFYSLDAVAARLYFHLADGAPLEGAAERLADGLEALEA